MTSPNPRLLVIDDNPADIELLRIAFELAQVAVDVDSCLDGGDALRLLQTQKKSGSLPDLLLLDLNMPRLNGFEVLSSLQSHGLLAPSLPVVVLSTSAQVEDRKRCLALGAREMYTKPESVQDLLQLVKVLLPYFSHPPIVNKAS